MKIKKIAIIFFLIFSQNAFAQKNTQKNIKSETQNDNTEEKNIGDIKTFDFERIFIETEQYFQAAKSWKKIICKPITGFVCTKKECPKIKIVDNALIVLDREKDVMSLCKGNICKFHKAEFEQTGVFINAKIKDSDGILIRVLGDSRFKEISMIGLDAYITNGDCKKFDGNFEDIEKEEEKEKNSDKKNQ